MVAGFYQKLPRRVSATLYRANHRTASVEFLCFFFYVTRLFFFKLRGIKFFTLHPDAYHHYVKVALGQVAFFKMLTFAV